MHAASLKTGRMTRTLRVLKEAHRKSYAPSTRDIQHKAFVCAVSTIISELRAHGYQITCYRTGQVWRYSLDRLTPIST